MVVRNRIKSLNVTNANFMIQNCDCQKIKKLVFNRVLWFLLEDFFEDYFLHGEIFEFP
jgi:hypothetical protein